MSFVNKQQIIMNVANGEYPFEVYSNVKLWWDFSFSSNITLSGTDITEIVSRDSLGIVGTPDTANSPTLLTASQNGLDVADFTSSNHELIRASTDLSISSGEASVFIVVKVKNDPPLIERDTGLWILSAQQGHYPWTDGNIYEAFATTLRKTISGFVENLDVYNIYHVNSKNSLYEAFLNNSLIFSTTTNSFVAPQGVDLGASIPSFSTSGRWLNGQVCEFLVLDRILTPIERGSMVSYLQNKWSI